MQVNIRNTFFQQRSPRYPEVGVLRWPPQTDGHYQFLSYLLYKVWPWDASYGGLEGCYFCLLGRVVVFQPAQPLLVASHLHNKWSCDMDSLSLSLSLRLSLTCGNDLNWKIIWCGERQLVWHSDIFTAFRSAFQIKLFARHLIVHLQKRQIGYKFWERGKFAVHLKKEVTLLLIQRKSQSTSRDYIPKLCRMETLFCFLRERLGNSLGRLIESFLKCKANLPPSLNW